MTDYDSRRKVPRYDPGVPATGVAAILVTVIALAAGFFVLRRVNDNADSVTSLGMGSAAAVGDHGSVIVTPDSGGETASTDATGSTIVQTVPTTPPVAATFTGTTIIVANANGGSGTAGKTTELLSTATDFQMADPTDVADAVGTLTTSVIYFDSATAAVSQPVADTLSRVLGGTPVAPLPAESPIKGERGASGVVLMLGEDLANVALTNLVEPLKASPVSPATVPAVVGTPTTVS